MGETLYICIDESGLPSRGDCYTVAGCWFVSARSNPNDILTPTKDRAIEMINTHNEGQDAISEIKGASLRSAMINDTAQWLRDNIYDDNTILTSHTVWKMNIPLGFTFCSLNPTLAIDSIIYIAGKTDAPQLVQTLSLNSVLTPLFHQATVDLESCDSVAVLLDASTWKRSAEQVSSNIETIDELSTDVEFEIRDSKSTPGIQLADLAAYSWRRNLRKSDCGTAAGALHDLRFSR